MKVFPPEQLRNVALVGHGSTGKTSLTEALLYNAGAINRLGRVEDGTTTTDYDPDEVRRHISVQLALAPLEWQGTKINLIDTPGYADFVGDVKAVISAADAVLVVVDAVAGVQVGTEQTWRYADERKLPRIVVVNRLDRDNADVAGAVAQLRDRFGTRVVAAQLPIGSRDAFRGVVDLVARKARLFGGDGTVQEGPIPPEAEAEYSTWCERLIETVAETDDDLVAKYLDGETLTEEEIRRALRAAVSAGSVVPVFSAAATANKGISPLLDALVHYLPSPAEVESMTARNPINQKEEAVGSNQQSPLAALVFKTVADPFVGKLSYFRVYAGELRSDSHVWNPTKEKDERIGQLMMVRGKNQEPVQLVGAGDIGAIAKLAATTTGDTLCARDHPLVLPPITFPAPVFSTAIEPKAKADLDRMGPALARIHEEDPTIRVHRETATGQTILSGMGESHVEITVERVRRKFQTDLQILPMKVPYRETIQSRAQGTGRHVKQTGGHGQYGVCTIEIEPLERGSGYQYGDKIFGGAISHSYRPAVDKGIQEAMAEGVLAGFPVVDVRATLVDGKEHTVDSSELAFKLAGSLAFKEAAQKAGVTLLEPILRIEIAVPEVLLGDVLGGLNTKRARVHGMDTQGDGSTVIHGEAPMAEMLRYATDLRSITGGRGTFTMEFDHYEEVPAHVQQQVVAQAARQREEARV